MTATQLQLRRDSAANVTAATPAAGEPGYDTTNKQLFVGDGSTAGGIKVVMAGNHQKQTYLKGTVGGTADVITLALPVSPGAYSSEMKILLKATANNTGAATINVNSLGAKNIKKMIAGVLTDLAADDIVSGGIYELYYDGTQFQIKGLDESVQTGGVIQRASSFDSTTASTTAIIPFDNSIPQNTEGTEFTQAALAFTPLDASSTLVIDVYAWLSNEATNDKHLTAALFVDTTANALAAGGEHHTDPNAMTLVQFTYEVSAASTSTRTYKLRYGDNIGQTTRINGSDGAGRYGGIMKSGIRVTEIL